MPAAYDTVPRAIRTLFIEKWQKSRDVATHEAERLRGEVISAIQQGKMEEFIPWAGQTVGLVHEVLPAAEIVKRIIAEAEEALRQGGELIS